MKIMLGGVLSLGMGLSFAGNCIAQTIPLNQSADSVYAASVGGRARSDYDSSGIRGGSFFLYQSVVETLTYDDNVFSTKGAEKDDFIIRSAPSLRALSNWGRHRLDLLLGVIDVRYADFSSESHTDFNSSLAWQIDIAREFNIAGMFGGSLLNEPRGTSDAPTSAAEPTRFSRFDASISFNKQFNRFSLGVGGTALALDYDDVKALDGSVIDQDNRDGNMYTAHVKIAYEFSPGYRVFGLVEGNRRDFGNAVDDRKSIGREGRAGLEFDVTRLMKGEISGGYFEQEYDKAGFATTTGMAFKGALLWNPTQLITVTLSGERRISDTNVIGSSGHVDTILMSGIDYEITRSLIGSPFINYTIEDYQGVNREDKTLEAGLNMQWMLNRYVRTGAFYNITSKDSNLENFQYKKNVIGGSLKIQF